ncbi:MAG: hypothetical protein US95_C0005G0009 [Candidatus Woesebacteria bacterium GW2011_GWB1_38_5]|uniref:Uncharacterized protein n=1 Tax=Candidatus Woesebacteria bacterium GW2011_GWB1_38_5 TaxID=1618568 RepID=A0A0G0NE23_9BACT|nr:MAG: hypothetical protein US95_C0005G0009 [Candidatus Woesebacteria bacterium GW2011_GWB1_38_5]
MIEIHPFGDFIPTTTHYLLLGSFTSKPSNNYLWFYANGRNHFWSIMEKVYGLELSTKEKQQKLFRDLNMALTDIIYSCERKNINSSLDNNLTNIVFNIKGVDKIIRGNNIKKIYFSSRFVESMFRKLFKDFIEEFPNVKLIYLPSPSPRFAVMSKKEKIRKYKELLPNFEQ